MAAFARKSSGFTATSGLLLFAFAGCQQVTTADGAVEHTIEWTVRTTDGFPSTPLAGVEVCLADTTNCEVTEAEGRATFLVPTDQEVVLTLHREDFGSSLLPDFTGEGFAEATSVPMASDSWLRDVAETLNITLPPVGTGVVVLATPIKGAQFVQVGGSSRTFYYDENGFPSSELQATTSFGWGALVDVDPGEAEIEIVGETKGCAVGWGWPADASNRFRVPVWAAYYTYASIACD